MLDRKFIDYIIDKAGLSEVVTVYNSAIEINTHLLPSDYSEEDGYVVLGKIIQAAIDSHTGD